jgi:hypothetical protein
VCSQLANAGLLEMTFAHIHHCKQFCWLPYYNWFTNDVDGEFHTVLTVLTPMRYSL